MGKILEVIEGPRRFSRVFVDNSNFTYQLNKKRKKENSFHLRCNVKGCPGSGIFKPSINTFCLLGKHNHEYDLNYIKEMKFLQAVKLRAEKEDTLLTTIYQEEASKKLFAEISLPSFCAIKSTLQKRRTAAKLLEKNDDQGTTASIAAHVITNSGMEIIEGPKRFSKIYIDKHGYSYLINRKKADGAILLRCHEKGCKGSGLFQHSCFSSFTKHSHFADPLQVNQWRFLHRCKQRVETEAVSLKIIYQEESERFKLCDLPPFKSIQSTLHKRRRKEWSKISPPADSTVTKSVSSSTPIKFSAVMVPDEVLQEHHTCQTSDYSLRGPKFAFPLGIFRPMPNFSHNESEKTINEDSFTNETKGLLNKDKCKRKGGETGDFSDAAEKKKRKTRLACLKKKSYYHSEMEVIEGKKRFSKLYVAEDFHIYMINKVKENGSIILKCQEDFCCGSGIYFHKKNHFQRSYEHSHKPSENYVDKCRLLSAMKKRVEKETKSIREIYEEEVKKWPNVKVGTFRQIESTLHKRRRSLIPMEPLNPQAAAKLFDEGSLSRNFHGNFFKVYLKTDSVEMLVFRSLTLATDCLSSVNHIHLDSSFSIIPLMFYKLVIVSVVSDDNHSGIGVKPWYELTAPADLLSSGQFKHQPHITSLTVRVSPILYTLMTGSSEDSFETLFKYIVNEYPSLSPKIVSTDFNADMESALHKIFERSIIMGSWFHYTQCLWRNIYSSDLAQIYFQDEQAKIILRSLMALPLLPVEFIKEALTKLLKLTIESNFHLKKTEDSIIKVIDYVRDHWFRTIGVGRLSTFNRTREHNYGIETLYLSLIQKLGIETPTLIKFVEKIFQMDEANNNDTKKEKLKTKKNLKNLRRIQSNEKLLIENCSSLLAKKITVLEFLKSSCSTIARHCLNDKVCDPDSIGSLEDPSDISEAPSFCQIGIKETSPSQNEFVLVNNSLIEENNSSFSLHQNITDQNTLSFCYEVTEQ